MKCVCVLLLAATCYAQATESSQPARDLSAERQQAFDLIKKAQPLAAMPLVEDLLTANPDDAVSMGWLAYCLFAKARLGATAKEAPALLKRALDAAERSKQLGNKWPLLDELISVLTTPGASQQPYSDNPQANAKVKEGEDAFSRGDNAGALAAYADALKVDPKLYAAALFAGDVCFRTKNIACASDWFGKAVAIDPGREAAYRYWGDALMSAGKMMEARDKFIEAVIAEPLQKPWGSLINWAKQNNYQLTAPKIVPPTISDNPQIAVVNPNDLDEDSGRSAWFSYVMTRAAWRHGLFAQSYPTEKEYRHSLAEEAAALSAVADAIDTKKAKHLDPQLMNVFLLKSDGLLEAWVLLSSGMDAGIAQDYAPYRATHHAEMRAYFDKYLIHSVPSAP